MGGLSYGPVIDDPAADGRQLDLANGGEKLVNDLQHYLRC